MAMSMKTIDEEVEPVTFWETCPPEILLNIFEMLPARTLVTCMYVNCKWRTLVEHVAEYQNKWKDIFDEIIPSRGDDFVLKSQLPLDYKQIFTNYELWNNLNMAEFMFESLFIVDSVKRINVYRDNVIVVGYDKVSYYGCETFRLRKTIDISCRDFFENDDMIVVAQDNNDRYIKLRLYKKASVDDFNLDISNVIEVVRVMLYRIENKRCYVLDDRNTLFAYAINYPEWTEILTARYYGNPYESCFLHAYNEQVFLMLKCGKVLYVNPYTRNFVKIFEVSPPLVDMSPTIFAKMFHKCGIVYGVAATEKFEFVRFSLGENNVFVYQCPNISCVTQHGEMIIMGYLDGSVEFHMPRLLTSSSPMRRFNIKHFRRAIIDLEIISIDVFESKGLQYLYIATLSQIIQLKIVYVNAHEYMFKTIPFLADIAPECSSVFVNY